MADFLDTNRRSSLMRRVRTRGTTPELYVRHAVWSKGFRYRLNVKTLPGRPDVVFRGLRTAVFVQGCFWHGHDCRKGRRPVSNVEFWNRKLDGNVSRDAANLKKLAELGWETFVIWECQLKSGTDSLLVHLKNRRSTKGTGIFKSLPERHGGRL